jgi:hypothetical protein
MEGYAGQMIRGLDKIYSIYNVILVPHNFLVIDDYIFFEKKNTTTTSKWFTVDFEMDSENYPIPHSY